MDVLILGASARAAAQSALRAGLRPSCADLFADRDLSALAPSSRRVDRHSYPEGLEAIAAAAPPSPWFYTGALENHPDLVDRISRSRRLWGNPGSTLRAVRDPIALADALRLAGVPHPLITLDAIGLPRDRSWLIKPLASAGGRQIRPLVHDQVSCPSGFYLQERIEGPSLSAIFVGHRRESTLLGVSRQWIGRTASDFQYRGSVGPWPLETAARSRVDRLGRVLAAAFGLVGLFGVDFLLRDGVPWPVEVNPRYTASIEVLELAQGRSFLIEHVLACDPVVGGRLRPAPTAPPDRPTFVGKAFLFAPAPCRLPESGRLLRVREPEVEVGGSPSSGIRCGAYDRPRIADIPHPGTIFDAGEPILTLFARGGTPDSCWERLRRKLSSWTSRLETIVGDATSLRE